MNFESTSKLLSLKIQERLESIALAELEQLGFDQNNIFAAIATRALKGGKHLRGHQVFIGALLFGSSSASDETLLNAACALEFYQCAALVHDDVVDRAQTRRGAPSAHCAFAIESKGTSHFGNSASIFLGDFFLALSDKMIAETTAGAMRLYANMALEVSIGQYLELQQSQTELSNLIDLPAEQYLQQIDEIVKLKSARYSVVYPILVGAELAGATEAQLQQLDSAIEPLGIAFQMRDDALGVFGDPSLTGKPVGDDIQEGKRTKLLGIALRNASAEDRRLLIDNLQLAGSEAGSAQTAAVSQVTALLRRLAEANHEEEITQKRQASWNAIHALQPSAEALSACEYLFHQLLDRAD